MIKLKFFIILFYTIFMSNLYSQDDSYFEKLYKQNESYYNEVYKEIYEFINNSNEVKDYFEVNDSNSCFYASNKIVYLTNQFFINEIIDYEYNIDSTIKKILREIFIKNEIEKDFFIKGNPIYYTIDLMSENCSNKPFKILIFFSPIHGKKVRANIYLSKEMICDNRNAAFSNLLHIEFLFYFKEKKIVKVFSHKFS